MFAKLIAVSLLVLAACGGSEVQKPKPPPEAPPNAVAVKPGTYKTAGAHASRSALAAVGPAIETTLIQDATAGFVLVLPNYDLVRGAMWTDPAGNIQTGSGLTLVHQDGTLAPSVTLTGTSDGTTLTGSINGTESFTVTLTTISATAVDLASQVGTYVTTSSSNGLWAKVTLVMDTAASVPVGKMSGYAWTSQADMQAGDPTKAVYQYPSGTITPTNGTDVAAPNPNTFSFGLTKRDLSTDTSVPGTVGLSYFTATGMVALTLDTNPGGGGQFSAVWAKQ